VVGALENSKKTYCYREEIRTKHMHPYSGLVNHRAFVTPEEISEEVVPVPPNTPQDLTSITKLRPEHSRT